MSAADGRKDDCSRAGCAHDRGHHFDKTHNCLAMRCECKAFREEGAVETLRPTFPRINTGNPFSRPHVDTNCTCDACREWYRFGRA